MLDFHTHILPGIDDGSEDVETSCRMLESLKKQNVDVVVATPHFYYDTLNLENFKEYRKKSLGLLLDRMEMAERPKLALGAEVRFFYGLDVYQKTEELCIEGSRFLLVEMPFEKWNHKMYQTLYNLRNDRDITPVIAHVERYLHYNSKREMMKHLVDAGALMQCNTSFFKYALTRCKAFKMYKEGLIQFIGTDCHNMAERKPDYKAALELIKSKNNGAYLNDLDFWESVFLNSGVILY